MPQLHPQPQPRSKKQDYKNNNSFPISCDVINTARQYVSFLRKYSQDDNPITDSHTLKLAALRYENCWLPLVAEKGSSNCFPPWDVYYVWHLHMLLPQNYKRYCERIYGRVIGHSFVGSADQERLKTGSTRALWAQKYPMEPFELTDISDSPYEETRLVRTLCEVDPSIANFYYQLSAPHYDNGTFLLRASFRYGQFMNMIKLQAGGYIPSVDIELMWKAHMLCPVAYGKDMQTYFGRVIDMDSESFARDSIDGPRFIAGIHGTSARWREVYQSKYLLPGCGAKNITSYGMMDPIDGQLLNQRYNTSCELIISSLIVTFPSSKRNTINLQIQRVNKDSHHQEIFKGTIQTGVLLNSNSAEGLGKVLFDTQHHAYIEVMVTAGGKATCVGKSLEFNSKFFPQDSFQDNLFYNHIIDIDLDVYSGSDPKVHLTCVIRIPENTPSYFEVTPGTFEQGYITRELEPFVNIPSWATVDYDDPSACYQAQHKIRRQPGYLALGCRIYATSDMKLAAVLVYSSHNDHLASIGISITNDLLPIPKQVSNSCQLTFNSDEGDRAMLIQNSKGDWGYCLAKLAQGKTEDTIKIIFYLVPKQCTYEFYINTTNHRLVRFDWLTFDLVTAKLSIGAGCQELSEYVTLGFVIGTLHMLTVNQPRKKTRKRQPLEQEPRPRVRGRQEQHSDKDNKPKRQPSIFRVDGLKTANNIEPALKHSDPDSDSTIDGNYDVITNKIEKKYSRTPDVQSTSLSLGQSKEIQINKDHMQVYDTGDIYTISRNHKVYNNYSNSATMPARPRKDRPQSNEMYSFTNIKEIASQENLSGQGKQQKPIPAERKRGKKTSHGRIIVQSKGPTSNTFVPPRRPHQNYTEHYNNPIYDNSLPARMGSSYEPKTVNPPQSALIPQTLSNPQIPPRSNNQQRFHSPEQNNNELSKSAENVYYPTRRGKQTDMHLNQSPTSKFSPSKRSYTIQPNGRRNREPTLLSYKSFNQSSPHLESCV